MKAILKTITGRSSGSHFQLLSDLHLEVGQQYSSYTFPVTAPNLILAGDIGRLIDYAGYLQYLEAQVSRYEHVFLVLGNHEFYELDYDSGIEKAYQLSQEPSLGGRVILLNKTRWDSPSSPLTVLGCTLWSEIPQEAYSIVASMVSDFKKISGWNVERHNRCHSEEAAWLQDQIAQVASAGGEKNRQVLVVTHHAPCVEGTSRPEHLRNPWSSAFATNLVGQRVWRGVKTWAFGHTHYSTDLVRDGIRVVANQRGYVFPGSMAYKEEPRKAKKKGAHEFDPSMVIVV
ncbi:putative calcineurin-like phosphoesterase [Xylariomycetidae sp. FL2044]|nr:putative calcineurin-like phosphoesterase [Xylariomycetidae sp. FL2044]